MDDVALEEVLVADFEAGSDLASPVVVVDCIAVLAAAEDVVGCCEALLVRAEDCWCCLDVTEEECWRGLEEAEVFWGGLLDWRDGWRGLGRLVVEVCCCEVVEPAVNLPILRT